MRPKLLKYYNFFRKKVQIRSEVYSTRLKYPKDLSAGKNGIYLALFAVTTQQPKLESF